MARGCRQGVVGGKKGYRHMIYTGCARRSRGVSSVKAAASVKEAIVKEVIARGRHGFLPVKRWKWVLLQVC